MRIEIYSAPALDTCLESLEWNGHFEGYLDATIPQWREYEVQRFAAYVGGVPFPRDDWAKPLPSDAVLRINIVPMGGIFKALGSIIGKLFSFLGGRSKAAGSTETPQGTELKASQGKANTAKLASAVPEPAGTYRRFVDYLTPPRRYFVNKREQWLVFLANIGPGEYQLADGDVKVGSTPFGQLGEDAWYGVFPPNADLSAIEAAQIWHTTSEVGGTSSGTAGLEMTTEPANRTNTDPAYYVLNGDTVTRPEGLFPSGWGQGTTVRLAYPRLYTIVDGDPDPILGPASEFTGYFGHLGGVSESMQVQVEDTTWKVDEIVNDAGGGIYTLTFASPVDGTHIRVTPGTREYTFGADIVRTITSTGDDSIAVSPGGFQGPENVATSVVFVGGPVYGEWSSEFVATPPGQITTTLEMDVFFPQGLCYLSDDGDVEPRSVSVEYQYRNVAGGPRVTISRTFSDATVDQIGFTEQFAIAPMAPAVRVRRVGAQSTSTQVQDKCQWYGLKARLPDFWRYPRWTTLAVALRSGGKLGAQSENQINVTPTRVLPTLLPNGTWTAPQPTRDISAFARYILNSSGVPDSQIDMAEMVRLHAIWTARGDTLDYVFDATTVKEALQVAFGAGMGEFTCGDGLVRPVREDVQTTWEQSYSPQNMTGSLRRNISSHSAITDYDGVDVEYVDGSTWAKETVQCRLPGDLGAKVEKVTLDGVTDRTRAWRIGMRRRRAHFYRRKEYSFSTELDALNSNYLDRVALFGSDPGYGQSALLVDIRPGVAGIAVLRSSEPLVWEEGAQHIVAYRRPDGKMVGPFNAAPGSDEYEVRAAVPAPWPAITLSQELPHLYFGTADNFTFPALITAVNPRGSFEVSVTAVNYDPRVYASDNQLPPA
ncbi:host specificity factor TipJ family phage tail protein [Achromobacter sp. UBA4530]|uniref:host specificity factor TipJ family phage tail protein n=1 Tax=Achromobacter sp. UBA4530 TaxID=1945912 RepID=UPI00257BBA9A|nr:host specificity factor TipJ family phage tail protein [Achromobacter sp. UBA4530]